jgi:hydroxymethylbilane synthase
MIDLAHSERGELPDVPVLRIGTRASALALWQTERVRAQLAQHGFDTERVEIRTTGDIVHDVPLAKLDGRAFFTKQLDDAILEGRIDVAVHSLKDLPTELADGLALAAVGSREDPRDALVAHEGIEWTTLPPGAVVGTSSLRRRAQLLHARPDLRVIDLRGNVDTRVAKLDRNPEWSAILLAAAGLVRLGLDSRISERLPFDVMLPAPGQGALAATVRSDDLVAGDAVRRALHDPATELAVSAERGFLRRLEGGCQVPVGAHAEIDQRGGRAVVRLRGRVVSLNGEASAEGVLAEPVANADEADALGVALAEQVLARGAGAILRSIQRANVEPVPEP